jgi:hypothetical protein
MMTSSRRKQVEALSEISDIVVKISEEDLERMESLAERITPFDPELGDRILEAYTLLSQLNDEMESALERLEPDTEDLEEEEDIDAAAADASETDAEDAEEAGEEQRQARRKRTK